MSAEPVFLLALSAADLSVGVLRGSSSRICSRAGAFESRARSDAEVDAFHAAARANGGTDNGAPGLRPHRAYPVEADTHQM